MLKNYLSREECTDLSLLLFQYTVAGPNGVGGATLALDQGPVEHDNAITRDLHWVETIALDLVPKQDLNLIESANIRMVFFDVFSFYFISAQNGCSLTSE